MNTDDSSYRGNLKRGTAELKAWHARSAGETALEPDLPIVDAHHHLYESLYNDPASPHRYRLEDFAADLSGGHRLIGTVYVEAYHSGWRLTGPEPMRPVGEVEMIANLTASPVKAGAGSCRVAAGIVSHADLLLGDGVAEVLEAEIEVAQGRLSGVRFMTARDDGLVGRYVRDQPPPHQLADARFLEGFAQLQRFGLAFDAWVFHHQLDDVAGLADAFPDAPIVVDHAGGLIGIGEFRSDRAAVVAQWRQSLRRLAERPNVFVKIGGLGMPVYGGGFEHGERPARSAELMRAWQPVIDTCVEIFSPSRCLFESNFPVDKQSCGYTELWNAYKLATRSLSPDERDDMFWRTASRVYRLPLGPRTS